MMHVWGVLGDDARVGVLVDDARVGVLGDDARVGVLGDMCLSCYLDDHANRTWITGNGCYVSNKSRH